MNTFLNTLPRIINFLKKYGVFIAPVVLFIFFMFLLIYSYTRSPQQPQNGSPKPSQIVNQITNNVSNTPQISISPSSTQASGGMETDEKDTQVWSDASFDTSYFNNLNATQTTLSDGSIQYSYDSDVPNRPNIIILKNGINIYQRTPFTNTPLSDQINYYGRSDYIARGSQFWGTNAITYIYLTKGIALIGDPINDQLFEQMIFQPGSLSLFEQYDTDMIGQLQKP